MIHYVIILLAVVCFTAQFAFTKIFEKSIRPTLDISLLMVAVTNLVGALMFWVISGFRVHLSPVSLFWAVALAVIMIPYYCIGVKILSLGSLAVYSMFMMLGGMLVPFFYGVLFLKETISVGQTVGTVLLTVSIVLQSLSQKSAVDIPKETNRTKALFFVLCVAIFFINGMTGVIAKAHETDVRAVDEISFTAISCTLTAVLALLLLCVIPKRREALRAALTCRPLAVMTLLGAAAYTGSFLHLKAAAFVPASIQFPLVSGGVIVLSALTAAVAFREKVTKQEWVSVMGAFLSTVLFAF